MNTAAMPIRANPRCRPRLLAHCLGGFRDALLRLANVDHVKDSHHSLMTLNATARRARGALDAWIAGDIDEAWPSGTISSPSTVGPAPFPACSFNNFGWADRGHVLPPNSPAEMGSGPVRLWYNPLLPTFATRRGGHAVGAGRMAGPGDRPAGYGVSTAVAHVMEMQGRQEEACSARQTERYFAGATIWSITCGGIAPCSIWSGASSTRSDLTTGASAISLLLTRNC